MILLARRFLQCRMDKGAPKTCTIGARNLATYFGSLLYLTKELRLLIKIKMQMAIKFFQLILIFN